MSEPLLVVSDKHKSLKKAVREVFPHAFKQPCLAHKMRNILCKVPRKMQKEIKRLVQQVFYASSYEEGLRLGQELIARFGDRYSLSYGMSRAGFRGVPDLLEVPGGTP